MAVVTDCLKKGEFKQTKSAAEAFTFKEIKEKLTTVSVLCLLGFSKVFEVTSDPSNVGISDVLREKSHHIAFFNEKLKLQSEILLGNVKLTSSASLFVA